MESDTSTKETVNPAMSLISAPLAGLVLLLLTMVMYPLGVTYDGQTAVMTQVLPFVMLTIGALFGFVPRLVFSNLDIKPSQVTLLLFAPLVIAAAIPQLVLGDTLLGVLFLLLAFGVHLFDRVGRSEEASLVIWVVMGFYAALSFASIAAPSWNGAQFINGAWLPIFDPSSAGYWGAIDGHREATAFLFFNGWMITILTGVLATLGLRGVFSTPSRGRWFANLPDRLHDKAFLPLFIGLGIWLASHLIAGWSFFAAEESARISGGTITMWWAVFTGVISMAAMFCFAENLRTRGSLLLVNWGLFTFGGLQENGIILDGSANWHSYFHGTNGLFVWFFLFFWLNALAIMLGVKGVLGSTAPRREPGLARQWWRKNWYGVVVGSALFSALVVRVAWNVIPFMNAAGTHEWDLTGGSDPWYMMRTVEYVLAEHNHFLIDMDRSYPLGAINPRPPLFSWSLAIGGMLLAPLLDVPATDAVWWSVAALPAIYGALCVLPVAGIGNRFFGKATGAVAAWLIALMPGHVSHSTLALADHDSFAILFLTLGFYFWLKAVSGAGNDNLVKNASWSPSYLLKGVKATFEQRPAAIANAALAGMAFATVALGWKGFVYGLAIVFAAFFLQAILNLFRGRDSMALYVCTMTMMMVAFLIPLPFYSHMQLQLVFDASGFQPMFYIVGFTFAAGWVAVSFRDKPWLMVLVSGGGLAGVILGSLWLLQYAGVSNGWDVLTTGGYYLSKNKIFDTIAEAQAPSRAMLFASFGPIVALAALSAGILALWQGFRGKSSTKLVLAIWILLAGLMAWRAGRFVFNATPPVAIMGAWALVLAWGRMGGLDIGKSWRRFGIGTPRARLSASGKALKKHPGVGAILIVFLLVFSQHAAYGLDSGIPSGNAGAKELDSTIYNITPSLLRAEDPLFGLSILDSTPYNPNSNCRGTTKETSCWYMGSFGSAFNGAQWNSAYQWMQDQDANVPFGQRPGFVSWWDYGFQALAQGSHPTVADNFQSGIPAAGNMLLAKGEADLLALFIMTLSEGDIRYNKGTHTAEFTAALHEEMTGSQVDEFVELNILGGDGGAGVEARSFKIYRSAGDTHIGVGYAIDDTGLPLATKIYRVYDSRVQTGINYQLEYDAMLMFNQTKERNDIVVDEVTHYVIGGYWYTKDLVEEFDSVATSIHRQNARLALGRTFLTAALDMEQLVSLYAELTTSITYEVSDSSGSPGDTLLRNHDIRYFAVDNRLYPTAGSYGATGGNPTGIFYAPTTLSGLDPSTYMDTFYVTQRGDSSFFVDMTQAQYEDEYKSDILRSQSQNSVDIIRAVDIRVDQQSEFFDTMIARTYIGYGSEDLGLPGKPSQPGQHFDMRGTVNESLQYAFPLPAAMMNHFVIANWYDANADENRPWYDANTYVKILKYYSGATLTGEVVLGDISTVPKARLLIERDAYSGEDASDEDPRQYWIPIGSVDADEDGHFEFRVPAGHIRVTAFTGFSEDPEEGLTSDRDAITAARNNAQSWQAWTYDILGQELEVGTREINPVTAILANVSGGMMLGSMEFNVTGDQADTDGGYVIHKTIDIPASSATGVVRWDGHESFDGTPLVSHELILTDIWTDQAVSHIWTTNGTVEGTEEHPRTFRGDGEMLITGPAYMDSDGPVLVSDFTGNYTREILHNHSFTGDGKFQGRGSFIGTITSNISVVPCDDTTVPIGSQVCSVNASSPPQYIFEGAFEGSGRVTANQSVYFTTQLFRETLVGNGIFVVEAQDESLETYGTINGSGLFSGAAIFSGDMVEPGSFHLVDALPGTYRVMVVLPNGNTTRLSTPLEVGSEPTSDIELLLPGSWIDGTLIFLNSDVGANLTLELLDDARPDELPTELCDDVGLAPCFITTNETGVFGFGPLPDGSYKLRLDADGDGFYECVPWFTPAQPTVCDGRAAIRPESAAEEFTLIDGNSPIPMHFDIEFTLRKDLGGGTVETVTDIEVWFAGEMLTDGELIQAIYDNESSTYRVELPEGEWIANASAGSELMLWEEFEITEDLSAIEWTLRRSVNVTGQILVHTNKEESPIEGVPNIGVNFQWGSIVTSVQTGTGDDAGNFTLLLPEFADVNMTVRSIASQLSNGTRFTVAEGMAPLVLTVEDGLTLEGVVYIFSNLTEYSPHIPGFSPIKVHGYHLERDVHWFFDVEVDSGRFVTKVQYGNWTLSVDDERLNIAPLEVEVSDSISNDLSGLEMIGLPENITLEIFTFIDHIGDGNLTNGTAIAVDFALVPISGGGVGTRLNVTADQFTNGKVTVTVEPGVYSLVVDLQDPENGTDHETQIASSELILELGLDNVSEVVEVPFIPKWRLEATFENFSGGGQNSREVKFQQVDGEISFEKFTDENGTMLDYIPEGEWLVIVDRYVTGDTSEEFRGLLNVSSNSTRTGLVWRSFESAQVTIHLNESDSGNPLTGFELTATSRDGLGEVTLPLTGDEGNVTAYLWPGDWTISLNKTEIQHRWILEGQDLPTMDRGEVLPQTNLTVEHWVTLGGNLFWDLNADDAYNNNEGIEDANITVNGESLDEQLNLTSDSAGTWQVFVPTDANYTVSASKLGFSPVTEVINVSGIASSTDLEMSAGNVTISGLVDYVQMEVWDDIRGGVTLQLIPFAGIERDSRTPVKVMENGSWTGEWNADVEPGKWVLVAQVVDDGIVGITLVDAGVHDGGEANLTMGQGGTLSLTTSWVDFEGVTHDLSEIAVPGAEMLSQPEITVDAGYGVKYNITVDENGKVEFLLPAGELYLDGDFETTERGMTMDYSAGLSATIASQQEAPDATLRFNRRIEHSISFDVIAAVNSTQTDDSNNEVDAVTLNSTHFKTIEFTITLNYTGNEAYDEFTSEVVFSAEDAADWMIEFYNGTVNGTALWVETHQLTLGLDGGLQSELLVRVIPASIDAAQSIEGGHIIKVRLSHGSGVFSEHALTVHIPQTFSANVTVAPTGTLGVFPGEDERVVFRIVNDGNGQDLMTFEIDRTQLPTNWSATGPSEAPWSAGENRTYSFTVFAPAEAGNEPFTLFLNITSEDGTEYEPVAVVIQAARPLLSFVEDDTGTLDGSDAEANKRNTFIVRVRNDGLVDAMNIRVTVALEEYNISEMSEAQTIPPGEAVEYLVYLNLDDVAIGKRVFTFTMTSDMGLDLESGSQTEITKTIKVSTPAPDSVNIWVPLLLIAGFVGIFLSYRKIRDGLTSKIPF
jgi:asparagine N-glycosylation enzyme membrane subunit Stt3